MQNEKQIGSPVVQAQLNGAQTSRVDVGMILQLADGEIQACNSSAEKILGLKAGAIVGSSEILAPYTVENIIAQASQDHRSADQMLHPNGSAFTSDASSEVPSQLRTVLSVTLQSAQPCSDVVMEVHKPDGDPIWLLINTQPLFATNQSAPYAVVLIFTDITQQRQQSHISSFNSPSSFSAASASKLTRTDADWQRIQTALKESEALNQNFFETSADCVKVLDLEGRLVSMNGPGLCLMEIADFAPFIGKVWADFWQDPHHESARTAVETAKAGQLGRFSGFCRTAKGTAKWWDVVVAPIMDAHGKPKQLLSTSRDVTTQHQAEQALQESDARLRCFVDSNIVGVIVADLGGDLIEANDAFLHMTGYSRADLQAGTLRWSEMTPPEWADVDHRAIAEIRETGSCAPFEKEYWRKDGTCVPVLVGVSRLPGVQEKCFCFVLDLTERKQTEATLRASHERLALLNATSSQLLAHQQSETLIDQIFQQLAEPLKLDFYFNYLVDGDPPLPSERKMMRLNAYRGFSAEIAAQFERLAIGDAVCGFVALTQQPMILDSVQQSIDPRTELIRSLGATAYASYPLLVNGQLIGTFSFASRRRTQFTPEEQTLLRVVCDQVATTLERLRLVKSLQQQTEELTQANRIKDEFLAVLSHELRSPLNPILGWTKLLQSGKLQGAKITEALNTIERNAKLQSQLIEDLLDVSRILRGKLVLNVATVDLASTITTALETVKLAAEAKAIQIQTQFEPFLEPVSGDAGRLQQVVWNLLSNAVKFTPTEGQVSIRLTKTEGQAQIQVTDTGKGISSDFLPYVFERFQQEDGSTTRKFGGLGVGLAIVRQIVELHGGTVSATSLGEEQGATFTVRLPLLLHSDQAVASTPLEPLPASSRLLNCLNVLVVDDDDDARSLVAFILQEEGATVQEANSAIAALQHLDQSTPDLLLSDIGMPEMDGYALIQEVRSATDEQVRQIPAIALTAYAGELNQQQATQAGFQRHLAKPIEPDALIAVIAELWQQ
ncbi:PAS domain S-box protein [Leptolyngbya sp. AN03gr2]|uniref:PAS domain-containing hybrid sensor histidine kinase/response regulator n=1 Tax=unclassified Leptolyngbya TaxID=2650499 RepID=UPI003D31044C